MQTYLWEKKQSTILKWPNWGTSYILQSSGLNSLISFVQNYLKPNLNYKKIKRNLIKYKLKIKRMFLMSTDNWINKTQVQICLNWKQINSQIPNHWRKKLMLNWYSNILKTIKVHWSKLLIMKISFTKTIILYTSVNISRNKFSFNSHKK